MTDDLLIARNPEEDSTLPYLVRIPLGHEGLVVKARQTWPREAKVYCHRADGWPSDVEVVERLPVRSCTRRGAAVDLVLDRARENRSQFVITYARGREMIFWQSPRTSKQSRPGVQLPTARAHGQVLDIRVDTGEKYPYRFGAQQATVSRQRLDAGDYAVELGGRIVAAVERKTAADLAATLLSGRLTYVMAELAALPRGAVVVEEGYSRIFKLEYAPGAKVAEGLAESQARFPSVPIVFCETRPLAQEWTYRWLGACLHELQIAAGTATLEDSFAHAAGALGRAGSQQVKPAQIRDWAWAEGLQVPHRGRIPVEIRRQWEQAHP